MAKDMHVACAFANTHRNCSPVMGLRPCHPDVAGMGSVSGHELVAAAGSAMNGLGIGLHP